MKEEQNKWIPCSVKMPEKPERYCEDGYIIQVEDVMEPFSAYWNGETFTDQNDEVIEGIEAWRYLPERYQPEQQTKDAQRQRETEEFFTKYQ